MGTSWWAFKSRSKAWAERATGARVTCEMGHTEPVAQQDTLQMHWRLPPALTGGGFFSPVRVRCRGVPAAGGGRASQEAPAA
jgi:hypothetical protein